MYCKSSLFSLFLFLCISAANILAQDRIGLTHGKFNGLTASYLNTSYLLKSENRWEIQIAGLHTFFDSNYGYIKNSNLFDAAINGELINIPDIAYDDVTEAQPLDLIFNTEYKKTYLDTKTDVLGPGAFYKINNNIVVGVSSKFRGALTSFEIPSSLNYYNVTELPGDQIFLGNTFQVNALAWSEYGIHYAQSLSKLSFGVNLKYLNGYTSLSFDNNQNINYIERSDTLIALDKGQFTFAHPIHGEQPDVVGKGWSIDLGINYKNEDGSYIGFSIIDLGYINLDGKNYTIDFEENQSIIYDDYKPIKTIDQQIEQMIKDGFVIDSTAGHSINLPTAISFQYQKSFKNNFGIEAQLIQNLKLSDYQVRHSNSLAVCATYDKKHFSAFLPITMYNYNHVRIGAAIRIGYLTLGSDKILSVIGKQDKFSGSDFYINLKFYPFKIGDNEDQKINCFSF